MKTGQNRVKTGQNRLGQTLVKIDYWLKTTCNLGKKGRQSSPRETTCILRKTTENLTNKNDSKLAEHKRHIVFSINKMTCRFLSP